MNPLTLLTLLLPTLALALYAPKCKTYPEDAAWPAPQDWQSLNTTVNGNLIKYTPPAAVCAPLSPLFNPSKCADVKKLWGYQAFATADPGLISAIRFTNNSCNPDAGVCSQGYYPVYVVAAKNAADVAAAVRFARKRNVRLNIKNTGHDFIGRSTARGSLSVWLNKWKGTVFTSSFSTSCRGSKPQYAGTITAGTQWRETYAAALAAGRIIVGGASGTVGSVGGYIQGGGHSPYSNHYGMAADQVLEFDVVTLDGSIQKVNECTNTDLWWALRGGGGGTFAVITSVTVKTYPIPKVVTGELVINKTVSEDSWWAAMSALSTAVGSLSDAGISGYYYTTAPFNLYFAIMHIEGTLNTTQAALAPLMSALLAIDPSRKLFFYDLALKSVPYASFVAVYVADNGTADATSESYLMPSRLLPREAMEKDPAAYLAAMKKVYGDGVGKLMLGNLVAGGQVARNRGLSMALNPAWRRAVTHMIVMYFFPATTPSDVLEVKRQELQRDFQAFRDLSPGSGAYINEADGLEPNKYQAFFGKNIDRLLEIKRKVDPTGILYCANCVGSDDWMVTDGKVCRK